MANVRQIARGMGITFLVFLCAPASVRAQGTAPMYMLEVGARYAEMEQLALQRTRNPSERTASNIAPMCVAQSKLKKYRSLFECLASLEARIKGGDDVVRPDFFLAAISGSSSDVRALPAALRAEALIDLGQYRDAIKVGEGAWNAINDRYSVGLWPPDRYRVMILSNLALASALAGDRAAANGYLTRLNDLSIQLVGGPGWRALRRHGNVKTLLAQGEYAKAMTFLEDQEGRSGILGAMLGLANLVSGLSSRGDSAMAFVEIPWLVMRGKALAELNRLAEARASFDEAFSNPRFADFGDVAWLAYYERGRIAERENTTREAVGFFRKAIDIFEQQRSSLNSETSKIGFVGDKQAVYARLVFHLADAGETADALDYVERSKSRALVDMLAAKKDFIAQGPDAERVRQVLAQLDTADLAARVQDPTLKPGESQGTRNLAVARQDIQQAAPELSSLVTVSSVPLAELTALIGADETLVEFYYQGEDGVAFVLDRDSLRAVRLRLPGLPEQVQGLRAALEQGTDSWRGIAQSLHAALWAPVGALVKTPRVVVVPHGVLHYLPFSMLTGADNRPLIDDLSLRYLPSASVLKFLKPALASQNAPLLVFGNPDLGDSRLDLRFAEGEARAVAELTPDSRVLLRKDASETNFRNAAALFSRMHFATHGKFQSEEPLASGLYLARDADNDGVLTVAELYSISMDVDLVTLSACETGLGKVAIGDDVVGLTRGFLFAGSRSVVASLWSVDDQATSELMKRFYENLKSMSKADALRRAQIASRERFPHPQYWAAFQLTGRAD